MIGIIDRFENGFVVVELEDGSMTNIDKKRVPQEAMDGDVIDINEIITIDFEKTKERKLKMEELTKNLWK